MSSAQLLLQLLQLSSGVSNFNNLQLLQLSNSNSLFAFSPQLLSFVDNCGNSFNSLAQIVNSPLNSLLLNLNGNNGGGNACLNELLQLEELFLSGNNNLNLNNGNNNNNNNLSNSTESSSSSNSTADVSSSSNSTVDASNATATATSSSAAAAAATDAKGKGGKAEKGAGKKVARGEIVQRSAGEKRRVLGGLGFVAFMLVGAFAL